MKTQHKHFLLILAIIASVSLPPVMCYQRYMKSLGTRSSSTSVKNGSTPTGKGNKTSESHGNEADKTHISEGDTSQTDKQDNCNDFLILIDPGHGGFDPGKVSPDGIEEKKINLEISLKLQDALATKGFSVSLTRDSDRSLNSLDAGSKKSSDLHYRTNRAAELNADLYISIHQNSYSAEYVHGAQVFYYSTSSAGKCLAETIQQYLISDVDPGNTRMPKGNSEYMVLVESPCTAVIVECGFLSNSQECLKLCDPEYQTRLASAIAKAVKAWYDSQT